MDWEDVRKPGSAGKGTGKPGETNAGGRSVRKPANARRTGKNKETGRQKSGKKRNFKKLRRVMVCLLIFALLISITVISATISYDYVMKSHLDASNRHEIVIDESEGVEFVIEKSADFTDSKSCSRRA